MDQVAKDTVLQRVGENLRAARRAIGKSQEQLALDCGLDRTYVGGIERGERNVAVLNLVRLASVLGIPTASLLEGL